MPSSEPKYARPKILVADAPDVAAGLRERGYAVEPGSFGQPVVVQDSAGYSLLNLSFDLPGFTEQEIIVANLAGPEPVPADGQATLLAPGVPGLWVPKAGAPGLWQPVLPGAVKALAGENGRAFPVVGPPSQVSATGRGAYGGLPADVAYASG